MKIAKMKERTLKSTHVIEDERLLREELKFTGLANQATFHAQQVSIRRRQRASLVRSEEARVDVDGASSLRTGAWDSTVRALKTQDVDPDGILWPDEEGKEE